MRIATLGPFGTFSHAATLKYDKSADIIFQNTIWDVFESLRKHKVDKGIVPIENSFSGSVGLSMDALMEFDHKICAEIIFPIKHMLAGNSQMKDIKYVYSHPLAFAQCEKFLRRNLEGAEVKLTASNAKSGEMLSRNKSKEYAAIVPELSLERYDLKCLSRNIQDSRHNVTRFFVLDMEPGKKTGNDRTSIAIYPHVDKPGLLYTLIGEFAKRKINLSKIESRPSKGKIGDYIFYIDLQGYYDDDIVQDAFEAIEKHFYLKVLGSYPREY